MAKQLFFDEEAQKALTREALKAVLK